MSRIRRTSSIINFLGDTVLSFWKTSKKSQVLWRHFQKNHPRFKGYPILKTANYKSNNCRFSVVISIVASSHSSQNRFQEEKPNQTLNEILEM